MYSKGRHMKKPIKVVVRAHMTMKTAVARVAQTKAFMEKILAYMIRIEILHRLRLNAHSSWMAMRS